MKRTQYMKNIFMEFKFFGWWYNITEHTCYDIEM